MLAVSYDNDAGLLIHAEVVGAHNDDPERQGNLMNAAYAVRPTGAGGDCRSRSRTSHDGTGLAPHALGRDGRGARRRAVRPRGGRRAPGERVLGRPGARVRRRRSTTLGSCPPPATRDCVFGPARTRTSSSPRARLAVIPGGRAAEPGSPSAAPGRAGRRAPRGALPPPRGGRLGALPLPAARRRRRAGRRAGRVRPRRCRRCPELEAARSPTAFLLRTATNHCLNVLRASRAAWREEVARLAQRAGTGAGSSPTPASWSGRCSGRRRRRRRRSPCCTSSTS